MFASRLRRFSVKGALTGPSVWDNNLRDRLTTAFHQKAIPDARSNVEYLPVARFISTLYELNILSRDKWPTARIVQDMHERGYAADVFTKPSYGGEPPPPLSLDECYKWAAHYRITSLNDNS